MPYAHYRVKIKVDALVLINACAQEVGEARIARFHFAQTSVHLDIFASLRKLALVFLDITENIVMNLYVCNGVVTGYVLRLILALALAGGSTLNVVRNPQMRSQIHNYILR